jgi:hypothetical protein
VQELNHKEFLELAWVIRGAKRDYGQPILDNLNAIHVAHKVLEKLGIKYDE